MENDNLNNASGNYSIENSKNDKTNTNADMNGEVSGWGKRHTQTLLGSLFIAVGYAVMVNISLALVAMTDASKSNNEKIYIWDKKTQNTIQSAFFFGFLLMMIPCGLLAQKYGWKIISVVSLLACGILSMTFPICTKLGGWYAACASRFLLGITMSSMFPCTFDMLGKWSPAPERGRNTSFAQSGAQFGRVLMMTTSGWMCTTSVGWPLIFYTSGIVSIILGLVMAFLGASTPDQHSTITRAEFYYIVRSKGVASNPKKLTIPWKKIMTSAPVWASIIAESGLSWQVSTTLIEVPAYVNVIYGINIAGNGMLNSLPYAIMFIMTFVYTIVFNYLIDRKTLTVGQARKTSNTIAMWSSALFLVAFAWTPANNIVLGSVFLVLSISLLAGVNAGFQVILADISPNFCGNTKSVSSTLANIWASVAPVVNGLIITDMFDVGQWRIVFCLSAAMLFTTNLIFILYANSDIQPWNDQKPTSQETERELLEFENFKPKV